MIDHLLVIFLEWKERSIYHFKERCRSHNGGCWLWGTNAIYPGVRLVVICFNLFICLYIFFIYFFWAVLKKSLRNQSTHVVFVLPIKNLEDNSSHFANHGVIGSGAPNVNFWKIYVRKTIWDLEFSEHFSVKFLACLPLLGFSNMV